MHLHYIYRNAWGFVFGHVSSDDMVRWTWHKTVLAPPTTGHGMFSGTGFYTKDGRPTIIYHGQGAGRNVIQHPADDAFDSWTEPVAVVPKTADGQTANIRHWDPDCWLMNDTYYAYSGGQNPQLMKSTDLKNWTYLGDLLHPEYPSNLGIPKNEDISCGNMFQIGGKWMLLCISHPQGARYYLGGFKDEKYLPTFHAMLSFGSNQFFAPESVLTRRRAAGDVGLAAEHADQSDRSAVAAARVGAAGRRRAADPAAARAGEAAVRRKSREDLTVKDGATLAIGEASGDAVELEVTFAAPLPPESGLTLLGDEQGEGGMRIVAGAGRKTLRVGTTEPPFELAEGEDLTCGCSSTRTWWRSSPTTGRRRCSRSRRRGPSRSVAVRQGRRRGRGSVQAWRMRTIYAADSCA